MSNALQVADSKENELLRHADEYLRKHKILELFEVRTYENLQHMSIYINEHSFLYNE